MQGYGKEVYITESDYSQYVKLDGKEYEILSSSYYDDETGNSSKNLKVFDTMNLVIQMTLVLVLIKIFSELMKKV